MDGRFSSWRIIDDADSNILYSPVDSWTLDSGNSIMNGTLHLTSATAFSITIRFMGRGIVVYSYVGVNSANYTLTMGSESKFSTITTQPINAVAQTSSWTGLETKEHLVVITKRPNHPDWVSPGGLSWDSYMSLDYIRIDGDILPAVNNTASSSNSHGVPTSLNATLSTAKIIGITLSSVAFTMFLAVMTCFWLRWRRRKLLQLEPWAYENPERKNETEINNNLSISATNLSNSTLPVQPARNPQRQALGNEKRLAFTASQNRQDEATSRARNNLLQLPDPNAIRVVSVADRPLSPPSPSIAPPPNREGEFPGTHDASTSTMHLDDHSPRNGYPSFPIETPVAMGLAIPSTSPLPPVERGAHTDLHLSDSLNQGSNEENRSGSTPQTSLSLPGHDNNDSRIGKTERSRVNLELGLHVAHSPITRNSVNSRGNQNRSGNVLHNGIQDGHGNRIATALLQEVGILREQVRRLTQMRTPHDGNMGDEPPPEYEGRSSDEGIGV